MAANARDKPIQPAGHLDPRRRRLADLLGSATPFAGLDVAALSDLAHTHYGTRRLRDVRLMVAARYLRWRKKRAWMHRRGLLQSHVPYLMREALVLPEERDPDARQAWRRLVRWLDRDPGVVTPNRPGHVDLLAWWRGLDRGVRVAMVRDNAESDRPSRPQMRLGQGPVKVRQETD